VLRPRGGWGTPAPAAHPEGGRTAHTNQVEHGVRLPFAQAGGSRESLVGDLVVAAQDIQGQEAPILLGLDPLADSSLVDLLAATGYLFSGAP
jgi:hypothetical protein